MLRSEQEYFITQIASNLDVNKVSHSGGLIQPYGQADSARMN